MIISEVIRFDKYGCMCLSIVFTWGWGWVGEWYNPHHTHPQEKSVGIITWRDDCLRLNK
jgi:hypothetical protein